MDRSQLVAAAIGFATLLALGVTAPSVETAPVEIDLDGAERTDFEPVEGGSAGGAGEQPIQSGSGDGEEAGAPSTSVPPDRSGPGGVSPLAVGVGLVVVLCVAVLVVVRGTDRGATDGARAGSAGSDSAPGDETEFRTDRSVPASNEVYRCWRRFVERVEDRLGDPIPPGATPADVTAMAAAAEFPEAPARELASVYCATRYGETPVTDARERRARRALDRLGGERS